ncbi:MAG: nucleotidyltransferase domain-containing protein [Oscillospiraceae bacterium]|nr:nucleotidyltransferase domain-containing protein [Oscillospiraceae bacterium]
MLTIDAIKKAVIPLAEKYNVVRVDLFGSYAEGRATEKSDADFLVKFNVDIPTLFKVMGFREELQNKLETPVDVITLPLEPPQDRLRIEKVISIYERA